MVLATSPTTIFVTLPPVVVVHGLLAWTITLGDLVSCLAPGDLAPPKGFTAVEDELHAR